MCSPPHRETASTARSALSWSGVPCLVALNLLRLVVRFGGNTRSTTLRKIPAFELNSEFERKLKRLARKTRCVRSILPRVQAAGKARASLKADKRHGCIRYSQPLACSTRATSSLATRVARPATPSRCGRKAGMACCSTATHGGLQSRTAARPTCTEPR